MANHNKIEFKRHSFSFVGVTVNAWAQPSPHIWSTWTYVHRVTLIEMEYRLKMYALRIPSPVIGSTWTFSQWKSSLKMSLDRCVFHHIDDTCNTFLVCFRAKSESIHCRSICDLLPSNHRHPGYSMSQSHCNMPNGEVSSKSTKDLIAFSRRVSGHFLPFDSLSPSIPPHPQYWINAERCCFFCRHSCDTDSNAAIYLRNRPVTFTRRCDNSVLSNYNERTNTKYTASTSIENHESWINFLHTISYMCHYGPWYHILSQWFGLCLWRWVMGFYKHFNR